MSCCTDHLNELFNFIITISVVLINCNQCWLIFACKPYYWFIFLSENDTHFGELDIKQVWYQIFTWDLVNVSLSSSSIFLSDFEFPITVQSSKQWLIRYIYLYGWITMSTHLITDRHNVQRTICQMRVGHLFTFTYKAKQKYCKQSVGRFFTQTAVFASKLHDLG